MPKTLKLLKDVQKLELDPTKRYLIFLPIVDRLTANRATILTEQLNRALKIRGIDCLTVMIDNPQDIRIIETPAHDPD